MTIRNYLPLQVATAYFMHTADKNVRITARQSKAARAPLGWSQSDLAAKAGVHCRTVHDFEKSVRRPTPATLSVLRRALEDGGVIFIPVNGGGQAVRLREPAPDFEGASDAASE